MPEDYDVQIRAVRRARGLSQAQLATLVGAAHKAVVYQWEGADAPSTMRTVSTLTWDEPADRRDQRTRMVEPSMDRRLVHRDGREHLLARLCARQYQRVKLLLRDT